MKHFTFTLSLLLLSITSITAQTRAVVSTEDYPFILTTDPEKPALYVIYSGRDGGDDINSCEYVFINEIPWGGTDYKVQIMRKDPNKTEMTELWYFMEEDGKIKIISAADHRMITVPNTEDGMKKAYTQTAEERTHAYYTWTLDMTDNCYAFKTSDGKSYLSHNGNWQSAGPQMGLYNANGSEDQGSRVFFKLYSNATTGINNVKTESEFTYSIFTITGKRIDKITGPGIYIVNGKKCVVH